MEKLKKLGQIIILIFFLAISCQSVKAADLDAPTIIIDKSQVKRGDFIDISGACVFLSEILIVVDGGETTKFLKTSCDKEGNYLYKFWTDKLYLGKYTAKSKVILGRMLTSDFNEPIEFRVSTASVKKCSIPGDFNNDCRVNLIDFSLLAFWSGKTLEPALVQKEKLIFNGDGMFDFKDFLFVLKRVIFG
ncbi:hypothetical protein ACFL29_01045 [Patescibacteria group bacterium]